MPCAITQCWKQSIAAQRWPSHSSAALSDMLSSTIKQRELANSIAAAHRALQKACLVDFLKGPYSLHLEEGESWYPFNVSVRPSVTTERLSKL